jgi:hypothetical protein
LFKALLQYFHTLDNFNPQVASNVNALIAHFEEETPRMRKIFERINRKYNYDNYANLVDQPELDTHLEFWRGSGEFDLAVMQGSLNGVYDPDPEFGLFYSQYESNLWKRFVELENDEQYALLNQISYDLFYTWIACLWQELHSDLGGFPLKLIENNAASVFNLIDFAWHDNSNYDEFLDRPQRRFPFFKRKLEITELYSRVKIPYKLEVKCRRTFLKDNLRCELSINEASISIKDVDSGILIYDFPIKKTSYSNSVLFVVKHNELINDGWKDVTYESTHLT